jgi:hypothetical protein
MTLQGPKQLSGRLLQQANTSRAPAIRCSSQDPDRQDPTPKQWTKEKYNTVQEERTWIFARNPTSTWRCCTPNGMVPIFLTTETQKFHCQQFYSLMYVVAYLDSKTNTDYDALFFKFYFPCYTETLKLLLEQTEMWIYKCFWQHPGRKMLHDHIRLITQNSLLKVIVH